MKLSFSIAVVALCLVGCGQPSVVGIWKGAIDTDQGGKARNQANRIGNPVLELKADQSFTLSSGLIIGGSWAESNGGLIFTIKTVNERSIKDLQAATKSMPETVEIKAKMSDDRKKIIVDRLPGIPAKVEFMR